MYRRIPRIPTEEEFENTLAETDVRGGITADSTIRPVIHMIWVVITAIAPHTVHIVT